MTDRCRFLIRRLFLILVIIFSGYWCHKNLIVSDESSSSYSQKSSVHSVNLLCMILCTQKDLISGRASIVVNAWAYKCKKYLLINRIDYMIVNITIKGNRSYHSQLENEPFNILHPDGLVEDRYDKLTEKMYLTIKDVYAKYSTDYDWFLKADLDTFVNVDNLNKYLLDKNFNKPVTYGFDFKPKVPGGFQSGGAGYVLSKKTLKLIGKSLSANRQQCLVTIGEDVDVHSCLRKLGVRMKRSLDAHGRERFHFTDPIRHFTGNLTQGEIDYAKNAMKFVSLIFQYFKRSFGRQC